MRKYTQRELKGLVSIGMAVDVSNITDEEYKELKQKETRFTQIGYSAGVYGCNGQLWQGEATGQNYAIAGRTQAIYRF